MQSKIRSLASDTLVYGVSTVVGRFLTFLLTPLYTNYLSAGEIGDVTAIFAMIAFVNIAYSLGLEPAFMRFWEREDEQRSDQVFSAAYLGVAVLGLVVTGLTVLLAPYIATSSVLQLDGQGADVVRIAAFIPLFDALVLIPFARLRMQRKPRTFALLRLLTILVNVALNIVFVVLWGWRVEGVLLAGVISAASTLVFFIPSLVRRPSSDVLHAEGHSLLATRYSVLATRYSLLKELLRFGLPTVPASFSSIMVQVVDRPILLMMTSSAVVGLYQTNFRLAIPLMMFVTVFEYAWKPFYLSHRDDADAKAIFSRVLTLFTIVCGAIFLITAVFMPYIVQMPFIGGRFINPIYWSGMSIIPIVMFAYFFNGVFINLAAGLHIQKKTGWLPLATGVAAVLNVVFTLVLVPVMDIEGAAWAKVIAYVGSVVVLWWYVQRVYPMTYDLRRIITTLFVCAAVYAAVVQLPSIYTAVLALPAYVVLLLATGVLERS
ncbi:MAG: hypothetical protein EHM43_06050, partial [Ignavibacteriae bacterium]